MTCPRCADLQRRLDEAEARAELAEAALGGPDAVVRLMEVYGLTRQQALLLRALAASQGVARHDALMSAISEWSEAPNPELVKVLVANVRKRCPSLVIKTVWGVGYRLDDASRSAVRAVIG